MNDRLWDWILRSNAWTRDTAIGALAVGLFVAAIWFVVMFMFPNDWTVRQRLIGFFTIQIGTVCIAIQRYARQRKVSKAR